MPPVAGVDDMSTTVSVNGHVFSVEGNIPDDIKAEDIRPATPKRRPRRHSVNFVTESKVIEFDKADEKVKQDIWYSRDEYEIIRARNSLIVKMMKTGSFEENDEHSFRGLEHKLKEGCKQRLANKYKALNAVLEEQDRQYGRGRVDDEYIAKKYRSAAMSAREFAFYLGLKDAERSLGDPPKRDVYVNTDDTSTISDLDTQSSENTEQKKNRIVGLFRSISKMKSDKSRRRASL
jgi:hypothetical protein